MARHRQHAPAAVVHDDALNLRSRFYQDARITLSIRDLSEELYIPRSNSDVTGRSAAPRHFEVTITKVWANE